MVRWDNRKNDGFEVGGNVEVTCKDNNPRISINPGGEMVEKVSPAW